MQFSDSTNKSGLVEKINFECDSDNTNYPLADKARELNIALETVEGWIRQADGVWQFDDENYSTIPEGTTDLVVGQSDYSFANTFLDVEWVKIKNTGGYWQLIPPVDQSMTDRPLEDWLIANAFPVMYDKVGDTIRLYPAPAAGVVTLTGGMKVGFKRPASLFSADGSDTTATPGFAIPYHVILAYMASISYCAKYKKDRVAELLRRIGDTIPPTGLKRDIIDFYSNRSRDEAKKMTMRPITFR